MNKTKGNTPRTKRRKETSSRTTSRSVPKGTESPAASLQTHRQNVSYIIRTRKLVKNKDNTVRNRLRDLTVLTHWQSHCRPESTWNSYGMSSRKTTEEDVMLKTKSLVQTNAPASTRVLGKRIEHVVSTLRIEYYRPKASTNTTRGDQMNLVEKITYTQSYGVQETSRGSVRRLPEKIQLPHLCRRIPRLQKFRRAAFF